uniref:Uncharacterized protein n=1 Tax=Meloidogyne javanica TaxID=6303 RepID=A0A915LDY5_MELJA
MNENELLKKELEKEKTIRKEVEIDMAIATNSSNRKWSKAHVYNLIPRDDTFDNEDIEEIDENDKKLSKVARRTRRRIRKIKKYGMKCYEQCDECEMIHQIAV